MIDLMVDKQLQSVLESAKEYARRAGMIQLGYFRKSDISIEDKSTHADIVTVADKESEKAVLAGLAADYPDHSILSEESGANALESDWRWVIDPLDGTTNFSQGLPMFSVSIGIQYKGETVVGVVYAPVLDELFHAVKGCGAFLNDKPISTSRKADLGAAVVATGFPVDKLFNPDNNLSAVSRVMPVTRGLRRLGSAALDLCYVAAGYLDAYWEIDLHEWDVCAGTLIAEEAGAEVVRFRCDREVSLIAATPGLMLPLKGLIMGQTAG